MSDLFKPVRITHTRVDSNGYHTLVNHYYSISTMAPVEENIQDIAYESDMVDLKNKNFILNTFVNHRCLN